MMILPLADALQNCLQNLTSRIAGIDNEQMAGRVLGMGTMLGFGIGAIKEQFKTPTGNIKTENSNNSTNSNNSGGGFKGFVDRAKSVINPTMNLTSEKDYDGNINPIRNVIPKEKSSNTKVEFPTSNETSKENMSKGSKNIPKSVITNVAKTGANATKTYLEIGAKMAEGNFDSSSFKGTKSNKSYKKNDFQNAEYMNKIGNNDEIKKSGDENEFKGKNKE